MANEKLFEYKRLEALMNFNQISIKEMSEKLGISTSTFYKMRSDGLQPSMNIILKLCSYFDVKPDHFFIKQPSPVGLSFFRKQVKASSAYRKRIDTYLDIFENLMTFFSQLIEYPDLNITDAGVTQKNYLSLNSNQIESFASELRELWGLGNGPISNLTTSMENNGIFVSKVQQGNDAIDGVSRSDPFSRKAYVMIANDKDSTSRQRFDLAHELAHCIMHKNIMHIDEYKQNYQELELQANRFASAFLLPAETFTEDFKKPTMDQLLFLKPKWKVSIAAMLFRAKELKLISEKNYLSLQVQISQRGWRKKEPYENLVTYEPTTLPKESLDIILDEVLDLDHLINIVGFNNHTMEKVLGLEPNYLQKYNPDSRTKLHLVPKN